MEDNNNLNLYSEFTITRHLKDIKKRANKINFYEKVDYFIKNINSIDIGQIDDNKVRMEFGIKIRSRDMDDFYYIYNKYMKVLESRCSKLVVPCGGVNIKVKNDSFLNEDYIFPLYYIDYDQDFSVLKPNCTFDAELNCRNLNKDNEINKIKVTNIIVHDYIHASLNNSDNKDKKYVYIYIKATGMIDELTKQLI